MRPPASPAAAPKRASPSPRAADSRRRSGQCTHAASCQAWAPPQEPAVPAYSRLRMHWKRPPVLGADLKCSELGLRNAPSWPAHLQGDGASGLVSEQMPAQILQCAFAQQAGMPLAGPGKFDDALGDDSVRKIVCKAEGRAGHFKSEVQDFFGSGIDIEVV